MRVKIAFLFHFKYKSKRNRLRENDLLFLDITQKISSMKTHYVTEFPNFSSVDIGTKNQIDSVAHNELQIGTETNLNSSFSVDDNSKNEKISAVSLQSCTEPNETHTGKIEVSQSLITSDDFQTLRNAEDDIPILKPSTGSKRRRAGKNITGENFSDLDLWPGI